MRNNFCVSSEALGLLLPLFVVLLLLGPGGELVESAGIVSFDKLNMTAYSNRNITVTCRAQLGQRDDLRGHKFTTEARMIFSLFKVPRHQLPVHQEQSFLHCHDPNRQDCYSVFNLDLSCVEDHKEMAEYVLDGNRAHRDYSLEAACQVDDNKICTYEWISRHNQFDCFELTTLAVRTAPRLGDLCYDPRTKETMACGDNQYCKDYCLCEQNYIAIDGKCRSTSKKKENDYQPLVVGRNVSTPASIADDLRPDLDAEQNDGDRSNSNSNGGGGGNTTTDVSVADTKSTFKSIVIFLLVLAVLLCIALGIVIIWSRHYRRLLRQMSDN